MFNQAHESFLVEYIIKCLKSDYGLVYDFD